MDEIYLSQPDTFQSCYTNAAYSILLFLHVLYVNVWKKERCNIGQFEKCFLSPKDKQIFFQAWYQNITKMVAFVGGSHLVVSRTFFSKKTPTF